MMCLKALKDQDLCPFIHLQHWAALLMANLGTVWSHLSGVRGLSLLSLKPLTITNWAAQQSPSTDVLTPAEAGTVLTQPSFGRVRWRSRLPLTFEFAFVVSPGRWVCFALAKMGRKMCECTNVADNPSWDPGHPSSGCVVLRESCSISLILWWI